MSFKRIVGKNKEITNVERKYKNNVRGITLIALVVSIVVLLILSGISIQMLTGENSILNRAKEAKEKVEVSNEKEAIEMIVVSANMNNKLSETLSYEGIKLYDRNQQNGGKWNIISINDTNKIYGTGWNYIKKGTDIKDFGITKNEWLVNYTTGELIQLEEGKYIYLNYASNLAVKDNIILNIDPSNMGDGTSWGNGVTLHGVEADDGYGWQGTEIKLDGVNDYIEVFSNQYEIEEGLTFEFFGKTTRNDMGIIGKTILNDGAFAHRFRVKYVNNSNLFRTCLAGGTLKANSNWSLGGSTAHWIQYRLNDNFNNDKGGYLTMSVDIKKDTVSLYWNGEYLDETKCNHDWLVGGKLTDSSIPFTIGMIIEGAEYTESYSKMDLYACRLYNKVLSKKEVEDNYNATVVYRNSLNN